MAQNKDAKLFDTHPLIMAALEDLQPTIKRAEQKWKAESRGLLEIGDCPPTVRHKQEDSETEQIDLPRSGSVVSSLAGALAAFLAAAPAGKLSPVVDGWLR
jgi:hypothetical protein